MEEAEGAFPRLRQFRPVPARAVEQAQRADDIGLDERLG